MSLSIATSTCLISFSSSAANFMLMSSVSLESPAWLTLGRESVFLGEFLNVTPFMLDLRVGVVLFLGAALAPGLREEDNGDLLVPFFSGVFDGMRLWVIFDFFGSETLMLAFPALIRVWLLACFAIDCTFVEGLATLCLSIQSANSSYRIMPPLSASMSSNVALRSSGSGRPCSSQKSGMASANSLYSTRWSLLVSMSRNICRILRS
mmetsp:Transcript_20928/g.33120  ORF Transcript_20928/g.33120 Transcript_20928/m.33120 type:complete len:207 (-) Transcript_20928:483-1103(-)